MQSYVALGLDPARFWDTTPRLILHEMKGAEMRMQRERALAWDGALLPYQKKLPRFEDFVGIRRDRSAWLRDFEAQWDRVDASLKGRA